MENDATTDSGMISTSERSSFWEPPSHPSRDRSLDNMVARYAPDSQSMAANQAAMRGRDEVMAFASRPAGEVHPVEVNGNMAITGGTVQVSWAPQNRVPRLHHRGWSSVTCLVEREWLPWPDVDTPSPDADVLYAIMARGL